MTILLFFFFSSRRRHTRCGRDWSSDVCSSDLTPQDVACARACGAVAVAVATGQSPPDELAACAPDLLFRDFSDVAYALAALTSCAGRRHTEPDSGHPPMGPVPRPTVE